MLCLCNTNNIYNRRKYNIFTIFNYKNVCTVSPNIDVIPVNTKYVWNRPLFAANRDMAVYSKILTFKKKLKLL